LLAAGNVDWKERGRMWDYMTKKQRWVGGKVRDPDKEQPSLSITVYSPSCTKNIHNYFLKFSALVGTETCVAS
jgi:hypothetical protein